MRIGVLGTTVASAPSGPVGLGGPKQRALLAALALHRGRAVAVDTLADLVWDGNPPPGVSGTLQGYVAGLRRALEPDRTTRGGGTLLVTEQPGYALRLPDDDLDTVAFETALASAHALVAPLADALCRGRVLPTGSPDAGGLSVLHDSLGAALALWRGVPFAELGDVPAAAAERARLEELRLLATEDRAALGILLRLHAPVAAELDALTRAHPLRERAWALRALALAGSGRQADALAALREVRDILDEELGLEPGAELRAVQAAVLRQDAIAVAEPAAAPVPPAGGLDRLDHRGGPRSRDPCAAAVSGALAVVAGRPRRGARGAHRPGRPRRGGCRLLARLRRAHRRARDRQEPTGDRTGDVRRRTRRDHCLGALLPRRRRACSVALGDGAGAARLRPAVDRRRRRRRRGVPGVGDRRADRHVRGRAGPAAARARRPPLGRHLEPASAAAAHRGRRRREPGPAAGAGHLARVPDADPCAGRGGRGAGPQARAAVPAPRHLGRGRGPGLLPGRRGHAHGRRRRRPPRAHGGQPLLRRGVRPARPRRRPRRPGRRGPAAGGRPRGSLTTTGPPGHGDSGPAPDGQRDRPDLRPLHPRPGRRHRRGHDPGPARLRHRGRPGGRGRRRPVPLQPRARARHGPLRPPSVTPGPRPRPCRRGAGRAARARDRGRPALAGRGAAAPVTCVARCTGGSPLGDGGLRVRRGAGDARVRARRAGRRSRVDAQGPVRGARRPGRRAAPRRPLAGAARGRPRGDRGRRRGRRPRPADPRRRDDQHGRALDSRGRRRRRDRRRCPARRPPPAAHGRRPAMLALAGEIYYGSTAQEREALADEAIAMARRLTDPELVLAALVKGTIAIWRGANAAKRLDMTTEAAQIARDLDDTVGLVSALALRAEAAGELGDIAALTESLVEGRTEADRIRHVYALLVLNSLEVSWSAMRGRFEEVDARVTEMVAIGEVVTIPGSEESIAGAMMMQVLWRDGGEEIILGALRTMPVDGFVAVAPPLLTMLCRTGRLDEARSYLDTHREHLDRAFDVDTWYSPMAWSMAAESACHLGDRELATAAYEKLVGLAGQSACAGSGSTIGPVDMFLSMAAHTVGDDDLASRHADRAGELCERWDVPLAADWVRRERERLGV